MSWSSKLFQTILHRIREEAFRDEMAAILFSTIEVFLMTRNKPLSHQRLGLKPNGTSFTYGGLQDSLSLARIYSSSSMNTPKSGGWVHIRMHFLTGDVWGQCQRLEIIHTGAGNNILFQGS
jgi:hypothetical protein